MCSQPEGCKVGVEFFTKHRLQVGLDECGACQIHVVSEQPQSRTVGHDAPQAGVFTVEELLHQGMGRLPPPFITESRVRPVQCVLRIRKQHGHRALASPVGKGKVSISRVNRIGTFKIFESKHRLDQRNWPVPVNHVATALCDPAPSLLVLFKLVAGNTPVARNLVSQRKRPREAVIASALVLRLQCGNRIEQETWWQDRTLGPNRSESVAGV